MRDTPWIELRNPLDCWREYYMATEFADFPEEPWDGIWDAIFDDE